METELIEKLLHKYREGETDLGEERLLRAYFRGPNVPAHLQADQELFRSFDNLHGPIPNPRLDDPAFDAALLDRLAEIQAEANDAPAQKPTLPSDRKEEPRVDPGYHSKGGSGGQVRRLMLHVALPLAATVLLAIGAVGMFRTLQPATPADSVYAYEEADAQDAYQQTRQALLLVSEKLNSGNKYVGQLSNLNAAGEVLFPATETAE
jgi:hypothetical protein